jgi:outer membrane protein
MNRTLKSIITITAFGAAALGLSAQPAIKLVTVDMSRLLGSYYKTEQFQVKFKADQQKAQEALEGKLKEGTQLADKYKETVDQSKNAMLTAEARAKAEADSAKMLDELQQRQNEINNFRTTEARELQQQANNAQSVLFDEIGKKVVDLAKSKGATLVLEARSGVIYADASYDITDEALALINKDRPATSAPAAASASPAPTVSAPSGATTAAPMVTVPGLAPKN